jgi:hypothetical protein
MSVLAPPTRRTRQRGVTLVVALLMLLVVTLFTVAAFNSGTANQQATRNMVIRAEEMSAAQAVVEATISTTEFADDPAAAAAVVHEVDVDGDDAPDYTARLQPAPHCRRARTLKTTDLDTDRAEDVACLTSGVATLSGIDPIGGLTAGDSMCANTEWDVRVTVTDEASGAESALTQGVGVRIPATDAADFCR